MKQFIATLTHLLKQDTFQGDFFKDLFTSISEEDFRQLLTQVIDYREEYEGKPYHYFKKSPIGSTIYFQYLHLSYEIYQIDGVYYLNILTHSKLAGKEIDQYGHLIQRKKTKITKPKGTTRKGSKSFTISANGTQISFTTVTRREFISDIFDEQKYLNCINSPFIYKPFYSSYNRTDQKLTKISTCGPMARCDGQKIQYKDLTRLIVGLKSLTLAVKAIADAKVTVKNEQYGIVHQDFKLHNLLLMANGILLIIDFGLATEANEKKRECANSTSGFVSPELLAEIVDDQRRKILKTPSLPHLTIDSLVSLREAPLTQKSKELIAF